MLVASFTWGAAWVCAVPLHAIKKVAVNAVNTPANCLFDIDSLEKVIQ
jgi:hypothetical protein